MAVAVLWLALVCAVQLACSHGWQRHGDSGELELFPLLPWLLEMTVLGKTLALMLLTFLQLLVLVPLASLWMSIPAEQWPQLWLGLGAGAVSLICLNQLAAGLMAGRRKAGALLGVVVLPFAIPVMIFGVSYCSQPQLWHPTMLFLIGNAVFLLPLHAVAVAAALRYGH